MTAAVQAPFASARGITKSLVTGRTDPRRWGGGDGAPTGEPPLLSTGASVGRHDVLLERSSRSREKSEKRPACLGYPAPAGGVSPGPGLGIGLRVMERS